MIQTEILKHIGIFSSLTDEELKSFYPILTPYKAAKGTTVFSEGDCGDEMFIVVSGKIGILVQPEGGEKIEIAEIRGGNFFGEMSVFDNSPRSATCIVKEDADLLALSGQAFFDSIEKNPETAIKIIYKMVNIIAGRLENSGAFLSDIVQWGDKARRRAITDEYTGLYNRRFFDDSIKEYFLKAKESGSELSLVMLDLDHFGTLNREYGQKAGDEAILAASSVFKSTFRSQDIMVRFGGDEFIFIMQDTGSAAAYDVCCEVVNKLCTLELQNTEDKTVKQITASIGIASFPEHAHTLDELKELSDKAVYQAKEAGRNRAMTYQI
ncbi:MAG: diguanylate cyclase [Spirochaetota bacterium]